MFFFVNTIHTIITKGSCVCQKHVNVDCFHVQYLQKINKKFKNLKQKAKLIQAKYNELSNKEKREFDNAKLKAHKRNMNYLRIKDKVKNYTQRRNTKRRQDTERNMYRQNKTVGQSILKSTMKRLKKTDKKKRIPE